MKIELVHTYGWMDALRGMRNPLNSWDRADSTVECDPITGSTKVLHIGPNDEKLIKALDIGGSPHRKFLRSIQASMDITAPAYWWAEMDTYKVATNRNSCSLQHKGDVRDFVVTDFTFEDKKTLNTFDYAEILNDQKPVIDILNKWRKKYIESGKKSYQFFRVMRQFMPMGYNYRATWSGSYETLMNIYQWRHNHKLSEWHVFCDVILEQCPYFKNLVDFFGEKIN